MQKLVREARVLSGSLALPRLSQSCINIIDLENLNLTISKETTSHQNISTDFANEETTVSKQGAAKEEQTIDSTSQNTLS